MKMAYNLLIVSAILCFEIGCQKESDDPVVGVILPLTGLRADLGRDCEDGINAVLKKLDERDCLALNVVVADGKGTVKDTLAQYRRIRDQYGAKYFIVAFSPTSRALVPIIEKDGILLVSTIASSHNFPSLSKNLFRVFVSVDVETAAASGFIINNLHAKRVAILGLSDESGNEYVQLMESAIKGAGGETFVEQFDDQLKDFSSIASKISNFKCDCVYLYCNDNRIGQIVKAISVCNVCPLVTTAAIKSPANVAQLKYCQLPPIWYPDLGRTQDGREGIERDSICLLFAHDALLLLNQAIRNAKYGLVDSVIKEFRALRNVQGAVGLIDVDDNGDISFPMTLNEFKIVQGEK